MVSELLPGFEKEEFLVNHIFLVRFQFHLVVFPCSGVFRGGSVVPVMVLMYS